MRDLSNAELVNVYGGGGRSKCPPKKAKNPCKTRGGSSGSSGGGHKGKRCGKGSSS
jgi:hypothetical protein